MSSSSVGLRPKKVGMRDVAAHAGVSISAVSLALNGKKDISEECRKRVLDSCRELGYRLNPSIQDMVRSSQGSGTRNLAFVLAGRRFDDHAYAGMIAGFSRAASEAHYHFLLEQVTGSEEHLYDLPPILRDGRVDGLVVTGVLSRSLMDALHEVEVPCVVLGDYEQALLENTLCVSRNHEALAARLVGGLAERGCRRIAYYEETPRRMGAELFYRAYGAALKARGMAHEPALDYLGEGERTGAARVLAGPIRGEPVPFDGIVAPDYRGAHEIAYLLRARFGFGAVPVTIASLATSSDFIMDTPYFAISSGGEFLTDFAVRRLIDAVQGKRRRFATERVMLTPEE